MYHDLPTLDLQNSSQNAFQRSKSVIYNDIFAGEIMINNLYHCWVYSILNVLFHYSGCFDHHGDRAATPATKMNCYISENFVNLV